MKTDCKIAWEYGEDMPYEYWAELIAYGDSEDETPQQHNGPSVVPATDAFANNSQDLPNLDRDTGIDTTGPSDDDEEKDESVIDEEKEIFRDTEFAVLALGEDPEHKEIESIREPTDDEYEEDEDENGIVVIKKRSELEADTDVEESLPVLSKEVANHYTTKLNIIIVRYHMDANVKHTTRDKDIPKNEIVDCIDTSASYAFVLGDQNDSLEEISERLNQEKTIRDGRENWIPFGDVYRHPKTHNVEVRAMSEDTLGKLAKAMDMSFKEVLEKLVDQVSKYKR